eukprot:TRINITY_DN16468_c0_g1_i1.p1 TRINITY_DN16468_c0_g1~~TRINITY_DN16468_c0_g1_i1.p1  ORF type:complete len:340 (+),score=41.81 TRINITY_DN16468_c0_g1_i1:36-1022(+)
MPEMIVPSEWSAVDTPLSPFSRGVLCTPEQQLLACLVCWERKPAVEEVPWADIGPEVLHFLRRRAPYYSNWVPVVVQRVSVPVVQRFVQMAFARSGTLLVPAAEGKLLAIDPVDGSVSVQFVLDEAFDRSLLAVAVLPVDDELLINVSHETNNGMGVEAVHRVGMAGDVRQTLPLPFSPNKIAVCNQAERIAIAGDAGNIAVMDLATGSLLWVSKALGHADMRGIAFFGTDHIIAVNNSMNQLELFSLAGSHLRSITARFHFPQDVANDGWGNLLVAGGSCRSIHVLDRDLNLLGDVSAGFSWAWTVAAHASLGLIAVWDSNAVFFLR